MKLKLAFFLTVFCILCLPVNADNVMTFEDYVKEQIND